MFGQVVHHVLQHALAYGAQAARARAVLHGLVRDGAQRLRLEHQLRVFEVEHLRVLLDQGVLRLGEDAHQVVFGQLGTRRDDRDADHELGRCV